MHFEHSDYELDLVKNDKFSEARMFSLAQLRELFFIHLNRSNLYPKI